MPCDKVRDPTYPKVIPLQLSPVMSCTTTSNAEPNEVKPLRISAAFSGAARAEVRIERYEQTLMSRGAAASVGTKLPGL